MEEFKVFIISVILTLTIISIIDSIRISMKNKANSRKKALTNQELELSLFLITIDRKDKSNARNTR